MTVSFSWLLSSATPPTWTAWEDAIRAWVVRASELGEDVVYFANQGIRRSELAPRITIDLGDLIPVGVDELPHDFDAGRPAGSEIQYTATGRREFRVELQAFAPQGGGISAFDALLRCQSRIRLPSYRNALNAVGLGVLEVGTVRSLPQVVAGQWEDGAFLEVRFSLTVTDVENTGYIETVEVTPELEE